MHTNWTLTNFTLGTRNFSNKRIGFSVLLYEAHIIKESNQFLTAFLTDDYYCLNMGFVISAIFKSLPWILSPQEKITDFHITAMDSPQEC